MSVIVKCKNTSKYRAFVKGSPEKVEELCDKQSLPHNFAQILEQYTDKGYRVIAFATKPMAKYNYMKIQRANRDVIERDLQFLGFLIMENKLKSATSGTI